MSPNIPWEASNPGRTLILGVSIAAGLGGIFFFGYLTGMRVVQDWEDLAELGPAAEVQPFVDDLTLVAGLLLGVLLALAILFRHTRRLRAKGIKAKEAGQTALHYPGVPPKVSLRGLR